MDIITPSLLRNVYVSQFICFIWTFYTYYIFVVAFDGVYEYEPTILEGCDPDRNAEYHARIEAEVEALIYEYVQNTPSED